MMLRTLTALIVLRLGMEKEKIILVCNRAFWVAA